MKPKSEHENLVVDEAVQELPEIATRILNAAIELFARKGYAATSVREIVQEAQVTNPMLYYYFDSKEGLFRVLTDLMHQEFVRDLREVVEADDSFEETLVGIVDVHLRGLREAPRVVELVYSLLFGSEGSCPPHELYERHAVVIEEISRAFERAIENGEFRLNAQFELRWMVWQLLGLVNSHSMRVLQDLQRCATDEEREALIKQHAGVDTSRQLAHFFLNGAGEVTE